MPPRRAKRGARRAQLGGRYDVLICGASFAGLTVARELAEARSPRGGAARVLLLDRYEVGERQTSACAAPTDWLTALGLENSIRQTFNDLVFHTPHTTVRYTLPWAFSTFDYKALCLLLHEQNTAEFEVATVLGRDGTGSSATPLAVRTDRGEISADLVVDALGWQRVLGARRHQPQSDPLARAVEVSPPGRSGDMEFWLDPSFVPAGYGWSFPAQGEVRIGAGSADRNFHLKQPTVELATRLGRDTGRFHGNWIPNMVRDGTEGGVFFVGDSAGHCLPLTAEGIRTAFYFGIACGRELRRVIEGRATAETALRRYEAFCARREWYFRWMLRVQHLVHRTPPRLLSRLLPAMGAKRFLNWSFGHYLNVAHPSFASDVPARSRRELVRAA